MATVASPWTVGGGDAAVPAAVAADVVIEYIVEPASVTVLVKVTAVSLGDVEPDVRSNIT